MLLKIPAVETDLGFDLSPDGTRVAFSSNRTGGWEIYVMPLDRSAPPRQVTGGAGAKIAPRWVGDRHAARLAYVVDLDGGEQYDICLYDPATGQHTNLTPDTPDSLQPDYCPAPDGSHVAFISDRSARFETYVVSLAGGSPRLVLSLPYPAWSVRWSPDGRWLAVVAHTSGQDSGTFIVPAEGGEPRAITGASGILCAKDPCWSPDSSRIAFASDVHGFYDVGIYELATGHITWVTWGEGDKEYPVWSPDGQRLAYLVTHGPTTALVVLELGPGSPVVYQVEPGVHYRPRFTPDGNHLVFLFDNPRHPPDLWSLALAGGHMEQLTHSLPVDLEDGPFAMPAAVCYPGLDGRSVPAVLYRPRQNNEGLPPAVVYVHGGPNWLIQFTWDPLVQHMVSRGWVVLAPNYRGSTGYGREWQLANRFDMGGGDTLDVVAGADYLVRQRLADPARIAVTGRSYGGYLAMTGLTGYPERWAAGSAVVPFLNWFTGWASDRQDLMHWDLENLGDPEKDHDLFYERSPYFFLDRVTASVQLICGAHDPRCPASESIQARDRLVALGKPCDFVLYPDEGHSFLKIENVVDAKRRCIAFLARALAGQAPNL